MLIIFYLILGRFLDGFSMIEMTLAIVLRAENGRAALRNYSKKREFVLIEIQEKIQERVRS